MALKSFRELVVWQRAFVLAQRIYAVTQHFPSEERYGLTAQMRRCAVSVPSNIAEGYHRGSRRDYIRFLAIAQGSLAELETQILLSRSLHLASEDDLSDVLSALDEVSRILRALRASLREKKGSNKPNPKP